MPERSTAYDWLKRAHRESPGKRPTAVAKIEDTAGVLMVRWSGVAAGRRDAENLESRVSRSFRRKQDEGQLPSRRHTVLSVPK
jgi:hypothetical protein